MAISLIIQFLLQTLLWKDPLWLWLSWSSWQRSVVGECWKTPDRLCQKGWKDSWVINGPPFWWSCWRSSGYVLQQGLANFWGSKSCLPMPAPSITPSWSHSTAPSLEHSTPAPSTARQSCLSKSDVQIHDDSSITLNAVNIDPISEDDKGLSNGDDNDRIHPNSNDNENTEEQVDELDNKEWDNGELLTTEEWANIMKLSAYEHQREMNMHRNKHLLAPLMEDVISLFPAKLKSPRKTKLKAPVQMPSQTISQ